ncbi:MAG: phage tail protein [Dehalococcoidia bacterium]|nr:phage tail protein [Dehalococcoidia bacterium]
MVKSTIIAGAGAATGTRFDPLTSARFCVEIGNIQQAGFTEASGLEAEIEVMEYQEGGNNLFTHKLPGRVKFPKVTLKRGITVSNDLWEWFEEVTYRKIKRKNISIVLYDHKRIEVRRWNLTNAYPTKWSGSSHKAGENTISIETLEFAHEGLSPG